MFADDIVVMSTLAAGLQNCLAKVEAYTTKWNLLINTKKTQVMIFNKGGHKYKNLRFIYRNCDLEITQSYTYLGILFSSCGNFNAACNAILDKSMKAFFKLKQLDYRNNVKLTLQLFDSLVLPVLMYGSEIW